MIFLKNSIFTFIRAAAHTLKKSITYSHKNYKHYIFVIKATFIYYLPISIAYISNTVVGSYCRTWCLTDKSLIWFLFWMLIECANSICFMLERKRFLGFQESTIPFWFQGSIYSCRKQTSGGSTQWPKLYNWWTLSSAHSLRLMELGGVPRCGQINPGGWTCLESMYPREINGSMEAVVGWAMAGSKEKGWPQNTLTKCSPVYVKDSLPSKLPKTFLKVLLCVGKMLALFCRNEAGTCHWERILQESPACDVTWGDL